MKKNGLMSYLALGIVFALFNVIAFVVPTDKTATLNKANTIPRARYDIKPFFFIV